MKGKVWMALGLVLAMGVVSSTAAQDPVKAFQQQMDKLVKQCTMQLEKADSIPLMNEIARDCNAEARALVDQLVEEIGPLKQGKVQVCVYNEALEHAACFDPINIVGSLTN